MKTDIKMTRTLLEKKLEELTDAEKTAISEYKDSVHSLCERAKDANTQIQKDCKILCSGYDKGFIPSSGWVYPILDFCYALEALNIQYAKYGLKVTSSQNKSKYGTYRCYYDIDYSPHGLLKWPITITTKLSDLLSHVNYKTKIVEISPSKVTVEWKEISEEQFSKRETGRYGHKPAGSEALVWDDSFMIEIETKPYGDGSHICEEQHIVVSNDIAKTRVNLDQTNVFKEKDGKFFYAYELHHSASHKFVPTKHLMLKKIATTVHRLNCWLQSLQTETREERVMREDFGTKVNKLVRDVEDECQNYCECCGMRIGTKWSPTCMTSGWISYYCEDCAAAEGGEYVKEGKVYREFEPTGEEDKTFVV